MPPDTSAIRMIWIVPKFPLGTPDGARHATCTLVRHLATFGARIDLVCLVPDNEETDPETAKRQLGVFSCTIISRSGSKFLPIPGVRTPFTFRSFAAARARQSLKAALKQLFSAGPSHAETVLVFDGLHAAAALDSQELSALSKQCRRIVYRAHNFETTLWDQCVSKARTPWSRWFFQYQAFLVRQFEQSISQHVGLIASVSEEDAHRFRALAPKTEITVTPIGMDFPEERTLHPVDSSDQLNLLFIGRLDWLPNRAGLIWFLETVWPALLMRRPSVTLHIAGMGEARWFERFRALRGISFLGRVENLQPLYEASALTIAPLFQGSGTRVKILESARYGRACVSTALGAEGSGLISGTSCFLVETSTQWLDLLGTITHNQCHEAGIQAFRSVSARFNSQHIAEKYLKILRMERV